VNKNTQSIESIFKFIAFIFLLPVAVAVVTGFFDELSNLLSSHYRAFIFGIVTFVAFHLFVFTPRSIYASGQKAFAGIFSLFPRAASVITLIVPLISSLLLIVLYLCTNIFKMSGSEKQFIFFAGFFLAFHFVLTAKDMFDEDTAFLKPKYFFGISFVLIINLLIIAALLDMNFIKFSFSAFLTDSIGKTRDLYLSFPNNIFSVIK